MARPQKTLFHVEALLETIHTAAGVNQLLLAGIERMALGADINLHLFLGGAGFKSFTAYAANHALSILGMNVFLHCFFHLFRVCNGGQTSRGIISQFYFVCNRFFLFFPKLWYNRFRLFLTGG